MDTDRNIRPTSVQQPPTTGTVDHKFPLGDSVAGEVPPAVGERYRISTLHRSGGLGRVWVARDAALGRDVALKDLRPDRVVDARLRARFIEEARITGQLEHPYIVPLYDLIDGADGPCYTMRFVAGRTLAEAARDYHERLTAGRATPLDLAGLLDAFVAVCRAVAYAHNRGVLHRDLKGQNIVLGEYGEVFVLDWGLAKLAAGLATPAPKPPGGSATPSPAVVTPSPVGSREETVSGAVLGTPAFLAPEQAGGSPASKSTDVYGLGGVLYVILTGGAPYDGPSMQDVIERVLAGPPRTPRTMNPACPPSLEAICHKAMARQPADRYASAEAVAADVRRWLADEPVEAYRDSLLARAARWARRHRPAVIGAAAVLMTAVFALAVTTTLVWKEERRTAEQRDRAEANLNLAHGLAFNLLDISEKKIPNIPQAETVRQQMTDVALDTFRHALAQRPDDPDLREKAARAYRFSANFHRLLGHNASAANAYKESINILETLVAETPSAVVLRDRLAEALRDQAQVLAKFGRIGDAVAAVERANGLAEDLRAADPHRPDYARTLGTGLIDLSGYENTRAQFAASESAAQRTADLLDSLVSLPTATPHPLDQLLLAMALNRRAVALRELDRPQDSLAACAGALAALRTWPPNSNDAQHFRGRILVEQANVLIDIPDRRAAAEADLGQAINQWAELRKRNPQLLMYREWQAVAYEARGRIRLALSRSVEAFGDLEKSRALLEQLVVDSPEVPSYRSLLGQTRLTLGRLELGRGDKAAATEWLRRAREAYLSAVAACPGCGLDRRALAQVEADLSHTETAP